MTRPVSRGENFRPNPRFVRRLRTAVAPLVQGWEDLVPHVRHRRMLELSHQGAPAIGFVNSWTTTTGRLAKLWNATLSPENPAGSATLLLCQLVGSGLAMIAEPKLARGESLDELTLLLGPATGPSYMAGISAACFCRLIGIEGRPRDWALAEVRRSKLFDPHEAMIVPFLLAGEEGIINVMSAVSTDPLSGAAFQAFQADADRMLGCVVLYEQLLASSLAARAAKLKSLGVPNPDASPSDEEVRDALRIALTSQSFDTVKKGFRNIGIPDSLLPFLEEFSRDPNPLVARRACELLDLVRPA